MPSALFIHIYIYEMQRMAGSYPHDDLSYFIGIMKLQNCRWGTQLDHAQQFIIFMFFSSVHDTAYYWIKHIVSQSLNSIFNKFWVFHYHRLLLRMIVFIRKFWKIYVMDQNKTRIESCKTSTFQVFLRNFFYFFLL